MSSSWKPARQLRFTLDPNDGESIPGFVARSVDEHVLVWTRPVLDAAQTTFRHLGYSQLADACEVDRLSTVVKCPSDWMKRQAGERLNPDLDMRQAVLRFGSLLVPRIYLELDRRRIAPRSLKTQNFHRRSWMNRLLRYCPESLQHLVDACGSCGSKLGWHYARGIDRCEYCDNLVQPSTEPDLAPEMADLYRHFALLSSISPCEVDRAKATLPASLHDIAPASLVRLALLIGGMTQERPIDSASTARILKLDSLDLTALVCVGMDQLRTWPNGFNDWISNETAEAAGALDARLKLRARLRRLVFTIEPNDLVALVRQAVPELNRHPVHSFAAFERHYIYREVQRRLNLRSAEMPALRLWFGDRYRRGTTSTHVTKGQFDAEMVDALVESFKQSIPISTCAWRLSVPGYAVHQLCASRLIEHQNHPAFIAAKSSEFVTFASLQALIEQLIAKQQQSLLDKDSMPLALAADSIGGRLKPWSSIFASLLNGDITYWVCGEQPTAKSILVLTKDLLHLCAVVDETTTEGVPNIHEVSIYDAAEILNLHSQQLKSITEELEITFSRNSRALSAPISDVLRAADRIAWSSEIARHLNVHPKMVAKRLGDLTVERVAGGWLRAQLVGMGVLPPLPGVV